MAYIYIHNYQTCSNQTCTALKLAHPLLLTKFIISIDISDEHNWIGVCATLFLMFTSAPSWTRKQAITKWLSMEVSPFLIASSSSWTCKDISQMWVSCHGCLVYWLSMYHTALSLLGVIMLVAIIMIFFIPTDTVPLHKEYIETIEYSCYWQQN